MGFQSYVMAHALIYAMKCVGEKDHIKDVVEKFDHLLDDSFPKRSENIQRELVKNVLLPLCAELMREEKQKFNQILEVQQHKLSQEG